MAERELKVALTPSARMRPIIHGSIGIEGVTLDISALSPAELIWRQLRFAEFDVSEMSLASYMIAVSHESKDWVGLPVFATRFFPHTGILIRNGSDIFEPADLRGKRAGCIEYQQTSLVWIRGILQHQFGVDPSDLEWWVERSPSASHGAATGFKTPPGVHLSFAPFDSSLAELMIANKLDVILYYPRDAFDRRGVNLTNDTHPLFSDPVAEIRRYYAVTGLFPLNHCVVVRRSIAESDPSLLLALYDMFVRSKALAEREISETLGLLEFSYGLAATANELATLSGYLYEQGLTSRTVALDELFAEVALNV